MSNLVFPVHYIELMESLVRAARGDMAQVRKQCGLSGGEEQLTLAQFTALLHFASEHLAGNEPLSLQILRHMPVTAHGMIGIAAMTSATLGDALDVGLRYFPLILPSYELHRVTMGNQVHVCMQRLYSFGSPIDEILTEMIPGGFQKMVLFVGQNPLGPSSSSTGIEVHFRHNAGADMAAYEAYFKGNVRFGCSDDRFIVSRAQLQNPLLTCNLTTKQSIEKMLERQLSEVSPHCPVSHKVRRLLSVSLLQARLPDAASIAEELNISVRTLSRRLSGEGTSLYFLIDEVRIERAVMLLVGSTLPLATIARQLGYSDLTTFSRAFKRIRGVSPSDMRSKAGKPGSA